MTQDLDIQINEYIVQKKELQQSFFHVDKKNVFLLQQSHTNIILPFLEAQHTLEKFDGIKTSTAGHYGIYTADCLPIVIYNNKNACILHAGWKGIINNIITKALEKFDGIEDIQVHIGPHIHKKNYLIVPKNLGGDDREDIFIKKFGEKAIHKNNEKKYLNLTYCALQQLKNIKNIFVDPRNTYTTKNLPSYFENKTDERILTVVSIKK